MSDPPPKAPIIRRRRPTGTIRADRAERILNEILRLQAEYVNGDEAPKVTCEEPGHRAFTSRKNVCLQSGAHFGQHYSMVRDVHPFSSPVRILYVNTVHHFWPVRGWSSPVSVSC